jgi:hypothetical protein
MPDNKTKHQLNFELPSKQTGNSDRLSKTLIWLLLIIVIAVTVNIIISLKKPDLFPSRQNSSGLAADQQKQLALKLENQGLLESSVLAWKQYLKKAELDDKDSALIWYRIGKLFQDNNEFENALDSYYRSESFAAVDAISAEIAIRIQECLESMGKFSAMRYELSDRVNMKQSDDTTDASDTVIAEIGTQKITTADLDRRMEGRIDQQIKLMAPYLPDEERNKQKETMHKQFSNSSSRMMYLNQFVAEAVLYRKARESKLTEDPMVRDLLNDQERSLLARLVLEKEYDNRINITLSDLETYYAANKEEFKKDDKEQAFDAVKNDVYRTLRTKKEQEIQQQLLSQLKDQYDVVIHQSVFTEKPEPKTETNAGNKP